MTPKTFIAAALGIAILLPSAVGASPFKHKSPFGYKNSEAFGLQVAEDINPDPNIVEINLEARVSYVELTPGIASEVIIAAVVQTSFAPAPPGHFFGPATMNRTRPASLYIC